MLMRRKSKKLRPVTLLKYDEPYREFWRALTPQERLRRVLMLRRRVPSIQKLHDEKLIPRI
jgi:hypothetical protein